MDLAAGQVIEGRYTVEGVVGEGGMAVVYRVRHNRLGSVHALKLLTVASKSIKERLVIEGQVQAQVKHPNIVAVTDIVEVGEQTGLVMEMVNGPSLAGFLMDHRLTLPQVDDLATGILRGVATAHHAGLAHRDLKPANILIAVTPHGMVPKVADFGLAKVLLAGDAGQTRSGATMGTPAYMAPEQIENAKYVDHRADLFSLGAILYEMYTGKRAFPGENIMEIFTAITNGEYELLPVETPRRVVRAIQAAMEPDLEKRVKSCQALLDLWLGRSGSVADTLIPDVAEPVWSDAILHKAGGETLTTPWTGTSGGSAGSKPGSFRSGSEETYHADEPGEGVDAEPVSSAADPTFKMNVPSFATGDSLGSQDVPGNGAGTSSVASPPPVAHARSVALSLPPAGIAIGAAFVLACVVALLVQWGGPAPEAPLPPADEHAGGPASPGEVVASVPAPTSAPTPAPDLSEPVPSTPVPPEPAVPPEEPTKSPAPAPRPRPDPRPVPGAVVPQPVPAPSPAPVVEAPAPEVAPVAPSPSVARVTLTGAPYVYLAAADGTRHRIVAGSPVEVPPGQYGVLLMTLTKETKVLDIPLVAGEVATLKCGGNQCRKQ